MKSLTTKYSDTVKYVIRSRIFQCEVLIIISVITHCLLFIGVLRDNKHFIVANAWASNNYANWQVAQNAAR